LAASDQEANEKQFMLTLSSSELSASAIILQVYLEDS
jgi:hypothetical protein